MSDPAWKRAWNALAPSLPTAGLVALEAALVADDERLIQGGTQSPPPMMGVLGWPVEAACPVAFCGWQDGAKTVMDVNLFFGRVCSDGDVRLGEHAGVGHFLRWWDDTPRPEAIALLLPVVRATLAGRLTQAEPCKGES